MILPNRLLSALLATFTVLWAAYADAQDCNNGKTVYNRVGGAATSCSDSNCHGPSPKNDKNNIQKGAGNPSLIDNQLDTGTTMAPLQLKQTVPLSASDIDDLAQWIFYAPNCPAASPSVSAAPTSAAFGNQSVGTSSGTQVITLTNSGGAAASSMIYPPTPSQYSVAKTCGGSIAAGASCTITFTFTPTAVGAFNSTYTVTGSGGTNVPIALSGTGVSASAPNVNGGPSSLSFGNVNTGSTSGPQTITVSNTGTAAAVNMAYASAPAKFNKSGTCSSATLNPGASCTVIFTYSPTVATTDSATYTITGGGATINVSLSGTGIAAATASLSPSTSSLSFGSVSVGTTSATQPVTITNTGGATATSVSVANGGGAAFPMSANTCGTSLAAGASCGFSIAYAPAAAGAANAAVTVSYAGGAPVTVNVSGTGTAAATANLVVSPPSLAFGTITVGTASAMQTVTLNNTGGAQAGGIAFANSNAAEFVVSGNTCGATLAAGASCSLNVGYVPSGSGADSASLTVSSTGAANVAVAMTGNGSAAPSPSLSATPPIVAFGNVNVGQSSAPTTITVNNTGGAAASGIALANSNGAEFVVSANTCASTLNAGASCSLQVAYTPTGAGADSAIVTFNYSGGGSLSVSLSGSGVAATPPGTGQLSMPAGVSLADTNVGSTSAAQSVTLSNIGSAAVTVTSIVSSNASEFPVSASTCSNVAAGASCTFSITFAPATTGMRSASITIASNGANNPQMLLASGNGLSASGGNPPPANTAVAVEYYHALFDHYFITAIAAEITKLDNGTFVGWTRTGKSFNVYPTLTAGLKTVCRFFSTAFDPKSSHFYTPDAAECTTVKANPNWQFEGDVFYTITPALDGTCPASTNPVYRVYNNGQGAAPNHRYTSDPAVRATMLGKGWIAEGYGPIGVIMCAPQ